jgi:hypothetical protein
MIPLARGAAIPLVIQTLSPTSGESCTTGGDITQQYVPSSSVQARKQLFNQLQRGAA